VYLAGIRSWDDHGIEGDGFVIEDASWTVVE